MDVTIKDVNATKASILTQALWEYSSKCSANAREWDIKAPAYKYWTAMCADAQNLAIQIGRTTKELFDK